MAAGERFTITSFSSVTSKIIAQNDYMSGQQIPGGLNIQIIANSAYLATIFLDNGVGVTDVTSYLTGAATLANLNGFYRQSAVANFYPWKVWLNVTSLVGNLNVAASV